MAARTPMSAALPRPLMSCILLGASSERGLGWDVNGQYHTPEYLRKELAELHFASTKARLEEAGDCWCVPLLPCSRLKSRSMPSKPKYTALSPASGKLTSRIEDVREEWHSNHLCNSPAASFLSSPVTLAHCCNPGRMSGSVLQCYFPRLWDGGEKRINKRISVIVPAFGGKWSILSAAVIRFCGGQKDFLFHSCIPSGMTESLAFRTSFPFWCGDQSLIFTLLFYIPWKHRALEQARLQDRTATHWILLMPVVAGAPAHRNDPKSLIMIWSLLLL